MSCFDLEAKTVDKIFETKCRNYVKLNKRENV